MDKIRQGRFLSRAPRLNRLIVISVSLLALLLTVGCAQQVASPLADYVDLGAVEAATLIQENEANPDFIILDVRTPAEYNAGHIEGALMIDFNADGFREKIDQLDRDKTYLVYCRTGNRSRGALEIMAELGFPRVYHLVTGIVGWQEAGLPVVS